MQRFDDFQKVTLTIGQLKKLVHEASENDSPEADAPEFEITDGVLTKYNGKGGDVVIPKGVKKITGWYEHDGTYFKDGYNGAFERNYGITSVKLPNGIEEIGHKAFFGCTNLKKVNLPDSLITIDNGAFCATDLRHIVIPASVNRIGRHAFGYGLKSAVVQNPHANVDNEAFEGEESGKTKVVRAEGNAETLVAAAAKELLTPTEDSKCGELRAETWTMGNTGETFVKVWVNGKEHEFNISQAKEFGDKLRKAVETAGGVVLRSEKCDSGSGGWYGSSSTLFSIPKQARKFGKPCREWETLAKIAEKYAGVKLDPMKCRFGAASGKRGRLWTPDEWDYIAFDCPDWCGKAVEWIRKTKTARDTLKVEEKNGEECDDRQNSSYYETECYGSMIRTYKFSVMTPNGKTKGEYTLSSNGYWYDS